MELLLDRRCGGERRYILADNKEALMIIPDEMRKCVVFVGYRRASDQTMILGGSAFWIVRPMPDFPDQNLAYLVTAAHIIKKIADKSVSTIQLRWNFTDGTWGFIETKATDWVLHDDPAADVAVLQIGFDTKDHDHLAWHVRWTATPKEVKRYEIGVGNELFFVGLFTRHSQTTKNIPIVRVGNIAAMPDENNRISTELGSLAAYLVESRSIGCLSGSPVFVDTLWNAKRGPFEQSEGLSQFLLIGLVHGHYDEAGAFSNEDLADDGLQTTNVNMGISVVIPIERVLEVLEKFSDSEKEASRKHRQKVAPTMDSDEVATETSHFTRTDFESALKKASRRVMPFESAPKKK